MRHSKSFTNCAYIDMNRNLFSFYSTITSSAEEKMDKALALMSWAEDIHGGIPPVDESLDSHDWWDHFPLVMPPEKFFKGSFIPPTPEGEAFAFLVRAIIVERNDNNSNLWWNPSSKLEYYMLFFHAKYTSYDNEDLKAWVEELRQAYISLLG